MLVKHKRLSFSESELMRLAARFFILERDASFTLKVRFCTGVVQSSKRSDKDMSQLEIFIFDALFHAMVHRTKLMQIFFDALYSELKSLAKIDPVPKQHDRFYEWIESNSSLKNTIKAYYWDLKPKISFSIAGW